MSSASIPDHILEMETSEIVELLVRNETRAYHEWLTPAGLREIQSLRDELNARIPPRAK